MQMYRKCMWVCFALYALHCQEGSYKYTACSMVGPPWNWLESSEKHVMLNHAIILEHSYYTLVNRTSDGVFTNFGDEILLPSSTAWRIRKGRGLNPKGMMMIILSFGPSSFISTSNCEKQFCVKAVGGFHACTYN